MVYDQCTRPDGVNVHAEIGDFNPDPARVLAMDWDFFLFVAVRKPAAWTQRAKTPGDAMNLALSLYEFLPLSVAVLFEGDILSSMMKSGVLTAHPVIAVVAERVSRVPDANRAGKCRVDFFVYRKNGEVVRFHPGCKSDQDMKIQVIPADSAVYSKRLAFAHGVGAGLHTLPPGMARTDNGIVSGHVGGADSTRHEKCLLSPGDIESILTYDANSIGWRRMIEVLDGHSRRNLSDVSDGVSIPWWLWFCNPGRVQDLVKQGITRFTIGTVGGRNVFIISRYDDYGCLEECQVGIDESRSARPMVVERKLAEVVPARFSASS